MCILVLPCKHLALCKKCFDDIARREKEKAEKEGVAGPAYAPCPLCRTPVKSSIEIAGTKK